jgi:hypothetical protein
MTVSENVHAGNEELYSPYDVLSYLVRKLFLAHSLPYLDDLMLKEFQLAFSIYCIIQ